MLTIHSLVKNDETLGMTIRAWKMIDITGLPRSTPEFRMNDFQQFMPRLDLPRSLVNRRELH
jgi:hypothetical protein